MKSISRILSIVFAAVVYLSASAQVLAQSIPTSPLATRSTFGALSGWQTIVGFVFNLFLYLGWAGVFIGIGFVLFSLIYKLMNADNEEAMKTVQGYITKAILIVIAGLLLISISFIINFVADFLGVTKPTGTVTSIGL